MSNGSELKSRAAQALRAAGYMPLPRLWVTAEQMELVRYMARQNEAEVNRIRGQANGVGPEARKAAEIEAAWRAVRADR